MNLGTRTLLVLLLTSFPVLCLFDFPPLSLVNQLFLSTFLSIIFLCQRESQLKKKKEEEGTKGGRGEEREKKIQTNWDVSHLTL